MTARLFLLLLAAAPAIAAAAGLSAGDRAFVSQALASGTAEVQRAALQVDSSDTRVRKFAGAMSTDHQTANQQLASLASAVGTATGSTSPIQPEPVTTPNAQGLPHARPGTTPASPVTYFRTEVAAHRQAIRLYSREASSGSNARLRAFAKRMLPILKSHLQLAQAYLSQEQHQR